MKLKVKKLHPAAILPTYATDGGACMDIAVHGEDWNINAKAFGVEVFQGRPTAFRTGLAFEVPPGWVLKVYSRSGHGFKNGVRLANCVGIIDSDYRGELVVGLTADDSGRLTVNPGARIAQAMLERVERIELEEVDELSETARGPGGFGSTGV